MVEIAAEEVMAAEAAHLAVKMGVCVVENPEVGGKVA